MELYPHQITAYDFLERRDFNGALFMDMGLGKTVIALKAFNHLRSTVNAKMIVICPIALIEEAWIKDAAKFFPNLSVQNMREHKRKRNADIFIFNYEMLHNAVNMKFLKEITMENETLCVLDESSKLKNQRSKITMVIVGLRDVFTYRIILSATPAPNNELEYYSQLQFLDEKIIGMTHFHFRANYFTLEHQDRGKVSPLGINRGMLTQLYRQGYKLKLNPDAPLTQQLKECAYVAKIDECLNMPETINTYRSIEIGPEQRKIYNEFRAHAIAYIGGSTVTATIALTKILKLREITSGFAFDESGEIVTLPNAKLIETKQLLGELGPKQTIIWVNFRKEASDLRELLGEKACFYIGKMGDDDKQKSINDFKSGRCQYFVANPASAGHGLTFINCHYQIFYSLTYSYELYFQSKGRTHRIGQTKSTNYIHLIVKDSIDEIILKILERKHNAQEILNEFIAAA